MKKIVVFALIAALCAGVLLYYYLGNLEQQKQVQIEYEQVVVAATNIPAFTPITNEMVTFKQIPQGYAHPLAARTLEEVVGYVTESDILEGEQVLPAKLKQMGETDSGMSYIVPEGMRAVTIAVDEVAGVAGFIQRGDYVDVISYTSTSYQLTPEEQAQAATATGDGTTEAAASGQQSQGTTVIAAQNVCVAAIGTTLSSSGISTEESGTIGYNSVTLFLTPEDAMRVIQGARSGSLALVMRASGDHTSNLEEPVVNDSLLEKAE
jgi:pilus assembly protein CpaB